MTSEQAERPQDQPGDRPGASETEQQGAHQEGGTQFDESGQVRGYTREGAVSAIPGGPVDPTIRPEEGQGTNTGEMVGREDAGGLTGETPTKPAAEPRPATRSTGRSGSSGSSGGTRR